MRIYIAGPVNGDTYRVAARYVVGKGHTPVNPHEVRPLEHIDRSCQDEELVFGNGAAGEDEHTPGCRMRTYIAELVKCDAIMMLNDWESSADARMEFDIARTCGLTIYYIAARRHL